MVVGSRGARVRMLVRLVASLALIVALTLALPVGLVLAQIDPQVRDRVVPAVAEIAILLDQTENGSTKPIYQPMGSGTIISPDGLILTNWHVVDMAAHRTQLDAWEAQASKNGKPLTYVLDEDRVLILTTDGASAPEPAYTAEVIAEQHALDLAVLRITGDAYGRPLAETPALPFVPVGDSSAMLQGDPIDLFGYPGIGGGTLTYTDGVVSGFNFEEGTAGPAWIMTNATMSGGSSGGAALDRTGRLIGIPTQGTELDCRPGDTNRDGTVDVKDVGCIPLGGSIGLLRPVNLAAPLLQQAGLTATTLTDATEPAPASAPAPPPPAPTPASSTLAAEPSDCVCTEAVCWVDAWDVPVGIGDIGVSSSGDVLVGRGGLITSFTPGGDTVMRWLVGSPQSSTGGYPRDMVVLPDGQLLALVANYLTPPAPEPKDIEQSAGRGVGLGGYDPPDDAWGGEPFPEPSASVELLSGDGGYIAAWGVLGEGDAQLSHPIAIDMDATGTIFVLELDGHVKQFTPDGTLVNVWSSRHPEGVRDLATGPGGIIYLTDDINSRIEAYTADGTFRHDWTRSNANAINGVSELAVGPDGSVYAALDGTHRVQRYAPDGTMLADFATGANVAGIDVSPSGLVFVASGGGVQTYCVQEFGAAQSAAASGPALLPSPNLSNVTIPEPPLSQADEAACATGEVYAVDAWVVARRDAALQVSSDGSIQLVPEGTALQVTGPYVENGACDLWPVVVNSVPDITDGRALRSEISGYGTGGLISETAIRAAPAECYGAGLIPPECFASEWL